MNPLALLNLQYALYHPAEFSPNKTWAAAVKCFHSGMVNTTPPAAMPTSTPTALPFRECGSGNVDACLTGGYGIERPRPTAALSTLHAPVPPHGQSTSLITGSHHRHGTGGHIDPLIH